MAPMALANFDDIRIDPDAQAHTLSFTCEVPWDMEPRLLGGHMHEHGESISISYKGGKIDQTVYSVDPWDKEKDPRSPPIWPLSYDPPKPMPKQFVKSSELSVRCTWSIRLPGGVASLLKFPKKNVRRVRLHATRGSGRRYHPHGDDRFFSASKKGCSNEPGTA
jgi:hypothetical protein